MNPPAKPNRRQMLERCISRGLLAAGTVTALSQTQLLAFWQHAEEEAHKPTSAEVLGPFFRKVLFIGFFAVNLLFTSLVALAFVVVYASPSTGSSPPSTSSPCPCSES